MTKNNHVVIIRFHYEKNDPRFEWRFQYFKDKVLPCLLEQTVDHFDIAIRCNPWHVDLFRELSPRISTFHVKNEYVAYKQGGRKQYFYDFAPWDQIVGLEKYAIQTGLDSDDLISPDYIELIEEAIKAHDPKRSLHICFQPELLDVRTGKVYSIGQTYTPKMGSAFMSIYQPDTSKKYRFVYEQSHLTLGSLFDESIVLPIGHCWASVHNHNESTGK